MHRLLWIAIALACLSVSPSFGAFTPPTEEQLGAAAAEPARVRPLLKEASVEQAALVAKDVIILIVKAGLPPVSRDDRIRSVVQQVFQALPGKGLALAAALGSAVAASPAASMSAAVVSSIQSAVVAAAGAAHAGATTLSGAGTAFGNAYNLSMQTIGGAPGGGKTVPPTPPPPPVVLPLDKAGGSVAAPPVAKPYEGQSLP